MPMMTRREMLYAAGGALGAAAIATAREIFLEARKREDNERERARALLESFGKAYDDLGDLPRRAAEFAETGRNGTVADVRVMYRHFARLRDSVTSKALTPDAVAQKYAPYLRGWGTRFMNLGESIAPSAPAFSKIERYNFSVLGPALAALSKRAVQDSGIPEVDIAGAVSNSVSEPQYAH
jgi:hypothetical protein